MFPTLDLELPNNKNETILSLDHQKLGALLTGIESNGPFIPIEAHYIF